MSQYSHILEVLGMRISTKEFGRRAHNSSHNRFIPEDPSTSIFRRLWTGFPCCTYVYVYVIFPCQHSMPTYSIPLMERRAALHCAIRITPREQKRDMSKRETWKRSWPGTSQGGPRDLCLGWHCSHPMSSLFHNHNYLHGLPVFICLSEQQVF